MKEHVARNTRGKRTLNEEYSNKLFCMILETAGIIFVIALAAAILFSREGLSYILAIIAIASVAINQIRKCIYMGTVAAPLSFLNTLTVVGILVCILIKFL